MSTSYPTTIQGGYDSPYRGNDGPPPQQPPPALPLNIQPAPPPSVLPPPPPKPPVEEPKPETVLIEDLLKNPGRKSRPKKVVIILRGPPGSGKSYVAKLIKVIIAVHFPEYPMRNGLEIIHFSIIITICPDVAHLVDFLLIFFLVQCREN